VAKEINYTASEKSILNFLKKQKGPVSTLDLIEFHYPNEGKRPFYARESLVTTISTLIRKIKAKKENFSIKKSERRGPHPQEYWVENKK
jgi:hypothetical protein